MDVGNPQTKQSVPKTLKMDSNCIKVEEKKNKKQTNPFLLKE